MKSVWLNMALIFALCLPSYAQQNEKAVTISGYANWLHNAIFDTIDGPWTQTSVLHNRVNMKVYTGFGLTTGIDIRNRFITGDASDLGVILRGSTGYDPGWIDMSWNIFEETSFVLNTMIDRAWLEFTSGRFQITAGRQRINWSQALVWNPNDIFNTYSFFDFDYTERPGSDAVRLVYSSTPSSAAEMALKLNHEGKVTAAALYRFSLLNTDIQVLAGETDEDTFTAGAGWSGAVSSYSLRGEVTCFIPFGETAGDKTVVIATVGVDRSFSDKVMALAQVMYCNDPADLSFFSDIYGGGLKASELAFSEFTAMAQVTYTPMPLLNISASAMWYPDLSGFFAGPSVDISVAENFDCSIVWQHFNSIIGGVRTNMNLGFLRFKYSF